MNLLDCVFILEHCIALRWRVAHLGRLHYCALAHPAEGYYFIGTVGVRGDGSSWRQRFRRNQDCGFGL